MKIEKIKVLNMKCSGCEVTITNALEKLEGVKSVEVIPALGSVAVECSNAVNRNEIIQVLHNLGYPEINEKNNFLLKAKSTLSCAIGRASKLRPKTKLIEKD